MTLEAVNNIPRPVISGTVTVSLSELDQLRANAVQAIKFAEMAALHEKEVKIVVVNGDNSNNKFLKSDGVKELQIHYKNLDDIREILRSEEKQKLQEDFDIIIKGRDWAEKELLKFKDQNAKLYEETKKYQKEFEELEARIDKVSKEAEKNAEKLKNLETHHEEVISNSTAAIKAWNNEYEKLRKAFIDYKSGNWLYRFISWFK